MNKGKITLWLIATTASGLGLKLALPPTNIGWLVFVAFVPVLLCLRHQNLLTTGLAGFAVGCWFYSLMPIALLNWLPWLPFLALLFPAMCLSLLMCLTYLLTKKLRLRWHWLAFPASWVIVVFLGQEVFSVPLALSPLLAFSFPELLPAGYILGFYGLEFVIAAFNSLVAILIYRRHWQDAVSLILIVLITSTSILLPTKSNSNTDEVKLYAVQPSIDHYDYISSAWSLYHRDKNEKRLDQLTKNALAMTDPGIVIWPEGGNNLPNFALQRRIDTFSEMLKGTESELIAGGTDFNKAGDQFNAMTHITSNGIEGYAYKNFRAPVAESKLTSGKATVFHGRYASTGIAICFEGLFSQHFNQLQTKGANLFILATDDSSLGDNYLEDLHAAYGIVFAAIHRTPLAFINNNGISLVANADGSIRHLEKSGATPKNYSWTTKIQPATPIDWRWHYLPLLLICLFVLFAWQRGLTEYLDNNRSLTPSWFAFSFVLFTLMIALIFDLVISALSNGKTVSAYYNSQQQRLKTPPALDAIAPLFKQSEQATCGAAATSFLLTRLGDSVFEKDFINTIELTREQGYNLNELMAFISSRGFVPEAVRGMWEDLPSPGNLPILAHVDGHHYVVVINVIDNTVFYFDPATGRTLHTSKADFLSRWEGVMLKVSYSSLSENNRFEIQKNNLFYN